MGPFIAITLPMFKLFTRESQTITQETKTQAVDFLVENGKGLRRVPLGGFSVLGYGGAGRASLDLQSGLGCLNGN